MGYLSSLFNCNKYKDTMKEFEGLTKQMTSHLKKMSKDLAGNLKTDFIDAEDIFQEALVYLWMEFKNGRLKDKNKSYILKGCYFYLKNFLRKVDNHQITFLSLFSLISDEGETTLEEVLYDDFSLEEDLNTKFLIEKIRNNGLTKREKEVFELLLEGYTTRQIGKKLKISHVRVIRIYKNIGKKYKEKLTGSY